MRQRGAGDGYTVLVGTLGYCNWPLQWSQHTSSALELLFAGAKRHQGSHKIGPEAGATMGGGPFNHTHFQTLKVEVVINEGMSGIGQGSRAIVQISAGSARTERAIRCMYLSNLHHLFFETYEHMRRGHTPETLSYVLAT
jgi:hypothetical protein